MASRSDGDITQAAERVWGILDHLAANNPEEYDKFVKQQLDHGKEALAVPEPRMCLRCSLNRVRCKSGSHKHELLSCENKTNNNNKNNNNNKTKKLTHMWPIVKKPLL